MYYDQFNAQPNPMFNQQMGFGAGPKPQTKATQPVTQEMSRLVYQNDDQLDVKISKIDSIKNQCTHKEPGTGNIALVPNPDGTVTCRTCGETFRLVTDLDGTIDKIVNDVVDVMQTVKLMYLDAPEEFVKQYFQCITLLKKLPMVYRRSAANFSAHEMYSGNAYPVYGGYNPNQNAFAAFNNMMGATPYSGPTPGYNPGFVDPRYGYGYQATPPQQPAGYPNPNVGGVPPQAAPGFAGGYPPQQPQPNPMQQPNPYAGGGYVTPSFTQQGYVNAPQPQATPMSGAPNGNPMAYGTPNTGAGAAPTGNDTTTQPGAGSIVPPANADEIQQTKVVTI